MPKKRLAVLASGSGTNLQAIIDAVGDGAINAATCLVLTDRGEIKALERAEANGIPQAILPFADFSDRRAFTSAVVDVLREHGADFVALAGFMRILTAEAPNAYPNAIINTHPALLPAFPGAHAVEQALAHGAKMTGCTVHFVDEEVDHGPIIAQEGVAIMPGDTGESLHDRIKAVEHRIFPEALGAYADGRIEVDGRVVTVRP